MWLTPATISSVTISRVKSRNNSVVAHMKDRKGERKRRKAISFIRDTIWFRHLTSSFSAGSTSRRRTSHLFFTHSLDFESNSRDRSRYAPGHTETPRERHREISCRSLLTSSLRYSRGHTALEQRFSVRPSISPEIAFFR